MNGENLRLLKVTFFACFVLLFEAVLFNVMSYIYDYFIATMGLGFVIIGIGFGAFWASVNKRLPEELIFLISCIMTPLLSAVMLLAMFFAYPSFWLSTILVPIAFLFPVFYISTVFKNHACGKVYLFDMIGAFGGVVATVLAYQCFGTETIICLLMSVVALVGGVEYFLLDTTIKRKALTGLSVVVCIAVTVGCSYLHITYDFFNLHRVMAKISESVKIEDVLLQKAFRKEYKHKKLVKTYDNLVGRIDVLELPGGKVRQVAYNGIINDHFTTSKSKTYDEYYGPFNIRRPTSDVRVLYGPVKEPKVCIIGSAAQGIIKTVKEITPVKNITAIEINPAIIDIMARDYYRESGEAYDGVKPIIGNAISVLKSMDKEFDIITFINTHSSRTIAYPGPPDYLHTTENYAMFLNHLTDKGYLLLEERPITENGRLAFYRQIKTLWRTLERMGYKDPERHFVIWEWMPKGKTYMEAYTSGYYISMVVTKKPINHEMKQAISDWLAYVIPKRNRVRGATRLLFLKDHLEDWEIRRLFNTIKENQMDILTTDNDFDQSIVTNNRPFLQIASFKKAKLINLLFFSGGVALVLWLLTSIAIYRSNPKRAGWLLNIYNILTGGAYFFIEIMLIQIYQNIFFAVASTLVYVLGLLLLSSGIGGYFSNRISGFLAAMMVIPLACLALVLPKILLYTALPVIVVKTCCILLIAITGFFMGVFFPKGLNLANKHGLSKEIPLFFAVNSIGGSLAIILSLLLAVRIGYVYTVFFAVVMYMFGAMICLRLNRNNA